MRSLVPSASSRRAVRLVLGLASLVYALSVVGVAPVLAHDSASGTPDVTITIGSGLSDRDVRVSVGDIVRFVNRDDDRHRMRSRSGQEFDTGNLEPGDSYQVRLSVAGTYTYLDERNDDAAEYRGRIVVVSASSGSGGSAEGTTPPAGGSEAGGSTGGGAASSATVTIGDDFYDPTSVRIAVGGSVEFRNTGDDEHSATSAAFDTGVLSGGASARKTFPSAGTFAFLCIFHSDMRGTIEVVAPSGGGGGTEPVAPRRPHPDLDAVAGSDTSRRPDAATGRCAVRRVGGRRRFRVPPGDDRGRRRRQGHVDEPGCGPAFGHGEGRLVRQRDARERCHVRADLHDTRVVRLPLCVPP